MIKGTFSLIHEADGGITITIEDYDVEMFNGCDYEWLYRLDADNTAKFTEILSQTQSGSLEAMITDEFGIHLDKQSVKQWLEENGIEHEFYSWVHSD